MSLPGLSQLREMCQYRWNCYSRHHTAAEISPLSFLLLRKICYNINLKEKMGSSIYCAIDVKAEGGLTLEKKYQNALDQACLIKIFPACKYLKSTRESPWLGVRSLQQSNIIAISCDKLSCISNYPGLEISLQSREATRSWVLSLFPLDLALAIENEK